MCDVVAGNSTLTVGLVYRNISIDYNEKIQNAVKEVSKRDYYYGDFNHGHIQWTSLQSNGSEDQQFLNLVQDKFPYSTCARTI